MTTFKQYLPLCWLGVSPLDLSSSKPFFKHNLIFFCVIAFFIQFNVSDDIDAIVEVLVEAVLTLVFMAGLLFLNHSYNRFMPLTTALLFCENIAGVVLVPILFWISLSGTAASFVGLSVFLLWFLVLLSYFFKAVVAVNSAAATLVALCFLGFAYGGSYAVFNLFLG